VCAAVGAGVVEEGKTYNVIGSSSWISCVTREPVFDDEMRTFNFVHMDSRYYTPCGTMQAAGNSLSWMKNNLCGLEIMKARQQGIRSYEMIDRMVEKINPGANNLLFLPYLLGERSPRWNPNCTGAFIGLTMGSTIPEMSRAVYEGIGYNLKVIMEIFNQAIPFNDIIVIGGGAKSDIWLQILADIWQKTLLVPTFLDEATSMGAAVCAGVGIGAFADFSVISKFNNIQKTVWPNAENAAIYDKPYEAFNLAYNALVPVYDTLAKL
jgi:xylulokinase